MSPNKALFLALTVPVYCTTVCSLLNVWFSDTSTVFASHQLSSLGFHKQLSGGIDSSIDASSHTWWHAALSGVIRFVTTLFMQAQKMHLLVRVLNRYTHSLISRSHSAALRQKLSLFCRRFLHLFCLAACLSKHCTSIFCSLATVLSLTCGTQSNSLIHSTGVTSHHYPSCCSQIAQPAIHVAAQYEANEDKAIFIDSFFPCISPVYFSDFP